MSGPVSCPRCGATSTGARTCPECGQPLTAQTRDWVWRALAFLAVALIGAVVAIAVSDGADGKSKPSAPATTEIPSPTTTVAPPTTTAPSPKPKPKPKPKPATAAAPSGWTVVLQTLPADAAASAAATAHRARAAGLAHVGVLRSSDYRTLTPGYLVVYMGAYANQLDATGALRFARDAGFPSAYPRRIAR